MNEHAAPRLPAGEPASGPGRDESPESDDARTVGTPAHFRRLHPLTPLLRGWAYLAAAIAFGGQDAVRSGETGRFAIIVLAVSIFGMLAGLASWWFTRYGFDGDALRIDSGILNKRSRRVRLDRLQAVDINRPLVGRLLGVSELRLEVAGGGDAEAPLQYLSAGDAVALRAELLARAAGIDAHTPEAPERVVHEVPLDRLVWSTVLSGVFVVGVGLILVVGGTFYLAPTPDEAAGFAFSTALPGLIAIGAALWNQLGRNFNFVLAESPDGYRIRKGLLDTVHQTVPPGRVQGVALRQPLFWRMKGWVRLDVDVAGYGRGGGGDAEGRTSTLLPVAPYEEAIEVMRRVLAGADPLAIELDPAPKQARWLRPIGWKKLRYGMDERLVVVGHGVLYRTLTVVPHAKTQSVRITQGPLQRRLDLATVHVDTTPGPVDASIHHRRAAQARQIAEEEAHRSRVARKADVPEQWMATALPGAVAAGAVAAGAADTPGDDVQINGTTDDARDHPGDHHDGDADGDGHQAASIERDQE